MLRRGSLGLYEPMKNLISILCLCLLGAISQAKADDAQDGDKALTGAPTQEAVATAHAKPQPKKELFTGQVVLLREALKRRRVESNEEFDKQVVLETVTGELIPIVPDWRGRAFFQDAKLRNRRVDLVGQRRPGVPYLQVLMVFSFDKKGTRQYTDYWCDICAIPMYEIKRCECCQGEIRLRFQPQDLPAYLRHGILNAPKQTGSASTDQNAQPAKEKE